MTTFDDLKRRFEALDKQTSDKVKKFSKQPNGGLKAAAALAFKTLLAARTKSDDEFKDLFVSAVTLISACSVMDTADNITNSLPDPKDLPEGFFIRDFYSAFLAGGLLEARDQAFEAMLKEMPIFSNRSEAILGPEFGMTARNLETYRLALDTHNFLKPQGSR